MTEETKYLTPEQAREQWAKSRGLPATAAPKFPEGTREHAEYSRELSVELEKFARGE